MRVPTVHLNGSSGERLLDQAHDAVAALRVALDALCEAGPNARDFYVQGESAALEAQREHEARVKALRTVRDEMTKIRDGVQEQIDAAKAARRAR